MRIERVTLLASDLDALQTFYGGRLGFPAALNDLAGSLEITIGRSHLVFQHQAGFAGRYHFAFNIPENRLIACKAFLEERSIPLIADADGTSVFDFDFWNAHSLYFYDAAGNIAEFIARHELSNAALDTVPFSDQETQSISEIALPCDDVSALGAALSENLGIAPYRETNASFMPLGDANGLFILVPVGRVWFPNTGIPAESLPVQVEISTGTGSCFAVEALLTARCNEYSTNDDALSARLAASPSNLPAV